MLLNFTKSSSSEASMDINVGLRLLPQIITNSSSSKSKSNILLKSEMRRKRNQTNSQDSCYLKTCNLCHKKLKPDKDIYMYRGDQGYCSVECRNRQIALDEIKEIESSTKQTIASYRNCCNDARLETRLILKDLQMQRLKSKPIPSIRNHWAIVS